MRFCVVGSGAITTFHRDALLDIEGVAIDSVVSRLLPSAQEFAETCRAEFATTDLAEALARPNVDAVLITSPNRMHYDQAMAAIAAGKHVLLEIPMTLDLGQAEELDRAARAAGITLMICHTERYYAPNLWLHERIARGSLRPLHLHRDWHFFRRENIGWTGRRRSWVDDILWHHGGHAVDNAVWMFGEEPHVARGLYGPPSGPNQVPLDLSMQMAFPGGGLASLVLSYNAMVDKVTTRTVLICEEDTFTFLYDELVNHAGEVVAQEEQMHAVPRQNREFVSAVMEGREPLTGSAGAAALMAHARPPGAQRARSGALANVRRPNPGGVVRRARRPRAHAAGHRRRRPSASRGALAPQADPGGAGRRGPCRPGAGRSLRRPAGGSGACPGVPQVHRSRVRRADRR